MKKSTSFLAFFYLLIALTGCKKEEDVISPIAGTWTYLTNGAIDCDETWYNYSIDHLCTPTTCTKVYFTEHTNRFTTDYLDGGTLIQNHGDYSISGGKLTRCWDDAPGQCETVDFSLVGETLTLSQGGDNGCTLEAIYEKD